MTQPSNRIPSLDGLRALAVLLVIASHILLMPAVAHLPAARLFNMIFDGAAGVQLFFVISGFIITYLFIGEERRSVPEQLSAFYLRRFVRIVPPLLAFLLVVAAMRAAGVIEATATELFASLLFLRNHVDGGWVSGHLWSLSVEEQFYLIWPVLLIALGAWRPAALALAIVIAPVARWWFVAPHSYAWLITNMDCLAAGCLIALRYDIVQAAEQRLANAPRALLRMAALMVFVGVAAMPVRMPLYEPFAQTAIALASSYLLISLTATRRGLLFTLANARLATGVGIISYDLYLWQQLFLGREPALSGNPLIAVPLALSAGLLGWFAISRPMAVLRSKLHRRISPGSVPQASLQSTAS